MSQIRRWSRSWLLLLLAGLAYAREFLMPVVLAFLLALVFTPVRRFLNRQGVPSWVTAVLVVGALLAAIVAGGYLLSGPVSDWVARAPSIFGELQAKMHDITATVAKVSNQVDKIAQGGGSPQAPVSDDVMSLVSLETERADLVAAEEGAENGAAAAGDDVLAADEEVALRTAVDTRQE